ncbi:chromate efflux transporter [Horticoccus sp. 23ND18S-11]|uniref:chromate efflux transporter n=1 Tax=Horticoccus sp. 23ND18S-11 TaxID=3391832 RepID=UPI0039C9677D
MNNSLPTPPETAQPPAESAGKLFLRFLRFGLLAWGGPVAQIDMIRHELVEEEKWISPAHFKRLLAIYQVLPGPEAHELCVHFGVLARGRWGGVLAGLGFMLPGFVLMFLLSWLYLSLQLTATAFQAVFLGIQPAVIALIVRACHRIGRHALTDTPLWIVAILAAAAQLLGVSFWITLSFAGAGYVVAARRRWWGAVGVALVFAAVAFVASPVLAGREPFVPVTAVETPPAARHTGQAGTGELFGSGLRAGLLTFGGAYTAIPFLKHDAVERGRWMTERDFLDGVALSGILPAPLIIFSTFVGYFGGGPWGALAMTLGVFLPAFGFSLLFHRQLEAVMAISWLKHVLDGVTAGVVGLIVVTTIGLARTAVPNLPAAGIGVVALLAAYRWKSKFAIPFIMLAAGLAGVALF